MNKEYRSPCASVRLNNHGPRNVNAIFQVYDTSDGDAVVETFRNEHIANRKAESNPAYRVRSYSLTMRD